MSATTLNTTQISRGESQPVGAQPKTLAQRIGEAARTCFEVLSQLKETVAFVFKATWRSDSVEARLCNLCSGAILSFADKVRLGWTLSWLSNEKHGLAREVLMKTSPQGFYTENEREARRLITQALIGESSPDWTEVWKHTLTLNLTTDQFSRVLRAYTQMGFDINTPITVGVHPPVRAPLLAFLSAAAGPQNTVNGWDKVLVLLQEPDIDVNVRDDYHREWPLHHAAYHGRLDVVQELISKGANREAKGYSSLLAEGPTSQREEITALEVAAIGGHLDVVEFLMTQERVTPERLSLVLGVGLRRELEVKKTSVTEERVERFIRFGFIAEGNDGCLLAAAACKNFKVAKQLLALGCNPFVEAPHVPCCREYEPPVALIWARHEGEQAGQELFELFLQDERLDLRAALLGQRLSELEYAIVNDVSEKTYRNLLQRGATVPNINRIYCERRTLLKHCLAAQAHYQRGLQALATVPADDSRVSHLAKLQTRIDRLRDLGASETPEENPR